MKKRYINPWELRRPIERLRFGFVGLVLFATGALALLTGETHYANYRGASVFAPFAVCIGLLMLIAVFT
jgi:hypothetical protein